MRKVEGNVEFEELIERFQAQLAAVASERRFQRDEAVRMLVHSRLLTAIVDDDPRWLLKGSFALQVLWHSTIAEIHTETERRSAP